ncbi:carbohydrate ABC transporter substrate-binding protein, CUT1 family [Proteiniborus ethanoligenes]|uniref:Carbohydrate ABC transporter substrate-binding protein, CUT1 family n=1 Tax=Proteiniborus ethanoligenes TaxID=415015 RepID=A0A1H3R665_9FIRM|nr:extracellular solute-binding protein [Proteiniborus ethanoligenes]SDZ21322.1 carbohydrate ABC transporter substrate-binding protein, CUT1 family [Proteiniborus ethanoligenes]
MKRIFKTIISMILIAFIVMWPLNVFIYEPARLEEINNKKTEAWKGVIQLWDFPRVDSKTGSRYGWIQDKIRKFERQNPGVFIELTPLDWKKGPIKLEVALKTDNLPDIAPIGTDYLYMDGSILEPLDEYFTESEIKEFKYLAMSAVTKDEKMWGVPFMMTTYSLFLNVELFKQRGVELPLDGNWTYDEFVEKMKALTWDENNDGKLDYFGFISPIKPDYYNLWGIILSDGAHIVNEEGKYSFFGEKAVSGLQKAIDLKEKHNVTPESFGICDENEAWDLFFNKKKVGVYPTGSWAAKTLLESYSSGEGFEYMAANYPIGDRRIPISLNNSVSAYGVFKQEDEGKLQMCIKFLKFITQENHQRELERLGVFPAKSNIDDIYINDANMKKIEDCLSYTMSLPKHKKWKEIDRILQTQIRLAILGDKTAEEAIEEARKQVIQLSGDK